MVSTQRSIYRGGISVQRVWGCRCIPFGAVAATTRRNDHRDHSVARLGPATTIHGLRNGPRRVSTTAPNGKEHPLYGCRPTLGSCRGSSWRVAESREGRSSATRSDEKAWMLSRNGAGATAQSGTRPRNGFAWKSALKGVLTCFSEGAEFLQTIGVLGGVVLQELDDGIVR